MKAAGCATAVVTRTLQSQRPVHSTATLDTLARAPKGHVFVDRVLAPEEAARVAAALQSIGCLRDAHGSHFYLKWTPD